MPVHGATCIELAGTVGTIDPTAWGRLGCPAARIKQLKSQGIFAGLSQGQGIFLGQLARLCREETCNKRLIIKEKQIIW